jgi:hypothetical protein
MAVSEVQPTPSKIVATIYPLQSLRNSRVHQADNDEIQP